MKSKFVWQSLLGHGQRDLLLRSSLSIQFKFNFKIFFYYFLKSVDEHEVKCRSGSWKKFYNLSEIFIKVQHFVKNRSSLILINGTFTSNWTVLSFNNQFRWRRFVRFSIYGDWLLRDSLYAFFLHNSLLCLLSSFLGCFVPFRHIKMNNNGHNKRHKKHMKARKRENQ